MKVTPEKQQSASALEYQTRAGDELGEIRQQLKHLILMASTLPLGLTGLIIGIQWSSILDHDDKLTLEGLESLECSLAHVYGFIPLLLLLAIAQILELVLAVSLWKGDSLTCARTHICVLPILWLIIMLDFGTVVWFVTDGENPAKPLIAVGSSVLVISTFLNYYLAVLSAYVKNLAVVKLLENTPLTYA